MGHQCDTEKKPQEDQRRKLNQTRSTAGKGGKKVCHQGNEKEYELFGPNQREARLSMPQRGIFSYLAQAMRRNSMGVATAVKNRFLVLQILVIATMAAPWSVPLANANTYRWVDENGQIQYSDHLPPQDVGRAYSILNKEGVTINSVEQAKTKEQLEEAARLQQRRDEQARLVRERATYDHILLDTYTKVSDLEETRDRYIATLEGSIKVAQHKLANLTRDLEKLGKTAANLEREGKRVPEDMSKDIATLRTQIEAENDFIRAQRTQQKEVGDKFAADIERYKELKAEQQSKK